MGIKYDDNLRISTVEKQIKQAYIQVYKSYSRPISHKISEKDAKRIIQQATMKDLER